MDNNNNTATADTDTAPAVIDATEAAPNTPKPSTSVRLNFARFVPSRSNMDTSGEESIAKMTKEDGVAETGSGRLLEETVIAAETTAAATRDEEEEEIVNQVDNKENRNNGAVSPVPRPVVDGFSPSSSSSFSVYTSTYPPSNNTLDLLLDLETDPATQDSPAEEQAAWFNTPGSSFPMLSSSIHPINSKDKGKQRADLAKDVHRRRLEKDAAQRHSDSRDFVSQQLSSIQIASPSPLPRTSISHTDQQPLSKTEVGLDNNQDCSDQGFLNGKQPVQDPVGSSQRDATDFDSNQYHATRTDLLAETIHALGTRLDFEPIIDRHTALRDIALHLLTLEPHARWDRIRLLDLKRQGITRIVNLDTLLPNLHTLDISNNAIYHISRLPLSLHTLKAKSNKLTDIDSLQTLSNLQYLDICNNAITSFEGINHLHHLRTLHAESNKLTSCSPFRDMNSLIHLNLRSNALRKLCFRSATMDSLETLDVAFNRLDGLDSIEGLLNLRQLNMEHNDIKWIEIARPAKMLKVLRLCYNRLKAFDGSFFPDLRTLYLDDNQLLRIIGLSCIPRLSSFSMRDQGGQKVEINMRYLRGTRKVYMSGTCLKRLDAIQDFFSLEYLELCSIQLESLPHDFSRQVPNLAVLYLSTNYLKDIRPLRKLRHLQKLVLLDNRIDSMDNIIEAVKPMTRLHYLDLRMNPVTSKMYPATCMFSHRGDITRYLVAEHDATWMERDTEFCRNLTHVWKERRARYRAILIVCCRRLRVLDGTPISTEEKESAEDIVAAFKQQQNEALA